MKKLKITFSFEFRWILCQGKGCHGFEDCRITFDDWPAMKPSKNYNRFKTNVESLKMLFC